MKQLLGILLIISIVNTQDDSDIDKNMTKEQAIALVNLDQDKTTDNSQQQKSMNFGGNSILPYYPYNWRCYLRCRQQFFNCLNNPWYPVYYCYANYKRCINRCRYIIKPPIYIDKYYPFNPPKPDPPIQINPRDIIQVLPTQNLFSALP
jgi:hypothetical protein